MEMYADFCRATVIDRYALFETDHSTVGPSLSQKKRKQKKEKKGKH